MKVVCPGSFDPITAGHYDFIRRAALVFDSVVVAVANNSEKKYTFTAEQRLGFARQAFAGFENVTVVISDGWGADAVEKHGADLIVKGVRNSADFEYEKQVATVNRDISGVETLLIPCAPEYADISSTAVRDMLRYGKDCTGYVPEGVDVKQGG